MATVDGITVAAADAIDKKHIAAMSVVGGDLVLTRENLATLSTPLPAGGGGGPSSLVRLQTPTVYQYDLTGYINCYFDQWDEVILGDGASLGVGSPAGSNSFDFADAGWYQITFRFWLGFTVVTSALPDAAWFQMTTWEGMQIAHELQLSAPLSASFGNRSEYGITAELTTPVFHDPGAAVAPAVDGDNNISLMWEGDALLKTGNGGAASGGNALTMQIARLG